MCRLSGLISACSGGASKKYAGLRTMYWSSGALLATSTAADRPLRRPARPARCHVQAIVPGYPAITHTSSAPMSMPSSRALVETTARTCPRGGPSRSPGGAAADIRHGSRESDRPCLVVRRSHPSDTSSGSRSTDDSARTRSSAACASGTRSRAGEFRQIRTSNPELRVDDRRIDEEKELLAARRAAFRHQLERLPDERLGQLARVGDRRRRAYERRRRTVMPADPLAAVAARSSGDCRTPRDMRAARRSRHSGDSRKASPSADDVAG